MNGTSGENKRNETNISMRARKELTISGIKDVISFCESNILLQSDEGDILIEGKDLHIIKMSVEKGDIAVNGYIYSISYGEIPQKSKNNAEKSGAFSKLFK